MMSRIVTTSSPAISMIPASDDEQEVVPADPEERDGLRQRHVSLSMVVRVAAIEGGRRAGPRAPGPFPFAWPWP